MVGRHTHTYARNTAFFCSFLQSRFLRSPYNVLRCVGTFVLRTRLHRKYGRYDRYDRCDRYYGRYGRYYYSKRLNTCFNTCFNTQSGVSTVAVLTPMLVFQHLTLKAFWCFNVKPGALLRSVVYSSLGSENTAESCA